MGVVAIREGADEVVGAGKTAGMNHFLVGSVGVAPAQIFPDGAGEENVLLEHHGNRVPKRLHIVIAHVHAAYPDTALRHVVKPGNQLNQGGLTGTGAAQDAHRHAGGNVQVDILQSIPVGGLGVAEGHVVKVHAAVLYLHHGVVAILQLRLLGENLRGTAHGRPGHGDHHKDHGQHHQRAEDLGGEGKHGGQLTGGQACRGIVSGGNHHGRTQIGNHQNAGVHGKLHQRVIAGQNPLGLAEILVDALGHGGEFLRLPGLPDKGLDHPDAVDILLNHIVEPIIGLEHPVEQGEHHPDQNEQSQTHQRQHHAVHQAQPGADGIGVRRSQNQHHGAADGHPDHHLEGHLNGSHIRGQPGDNGRGGKPVNIGKIKFLHLIIHIVAQIPGKARGCPGGKHRRGNAENQGDQGVEHQQSAVAHHRAHIRLTDAQVNDLRQHQRNPGFHVDLADHGDRAQNRVPFVFPDAPDKGFYHALVSSFG